MEEKKHIVNHILHIYRSKFVFKKKKRKKREKNAYLLVSWGPSMAVVSEWLAAVGLGRAQNLEDKVHHLQIGTTFQKWKLFKTKPKRKFFKFFFSHYLEAKNVIFGLNLLQFMCNVYPVSLSNYPAVLMG